MSRWITFSLFKTEVFILWMLVVVEFPRIGLVEEHLRSRRPTLIGFPPPKAPTCGVNSIKPGEEDYSLISLLSLNLKQTEPA